MLLVRYSEASCNSLEPTPTEENYGSYNLGPEMDRNENNDEELNFEQPKELTSGSRFDLKYDIFKYRAGKEYESKFKLNCFSSLDPLILAVVLN